jgi:hypothetical protein
MNQDTGRTIPDDWPGTEIVVVATERHAIVSIQLDLGQVWHWTFQTKAAGGWVQRHDDWLERRH